MQRKSFADMACPIARSLEQVGEWWSMLILRDAFAGMTRFDDFQQSLGIAPNMLARRLAALVEPACSSGAATASGRRATNTSSPSAAATSSRCWSRCVAFGKKHFAAPAARAVPIGASPSRLRRRRRHADAAPRTRRQARA